MGYTIMTMWVLIGAPNLHLVWYPTETECAAMVGGSRDMGITSLHCEPFPIYVESKDGFMKDLFTPSYMDTTKQD